jgi:hypothetical protein
MLTNISMPHVISRQENEPLVPLKRPLIMAGSVQAGFQVEYRVL